MRSNLLKKLNKSVSVGEQRYKYNHNQIHKHLEREEPKFRLDKEAASNPY